MAPYTSTGPRVAGSDWRRPPPRVLLVEDEGLVAMMMADALEQAGYLVCGAAGTATEALRIAEGAAPGFAIVDIRLGAGCDGLEVGRALAARGVTVLYASAYGFGFRQEMEDSGGRACLQKPFVAEDLPAALSALEKLHRGEAPDHVPPGFHLFVD